MSNVPLKATIEVANAVAMMPATLPEPWQFEWTTGYGAWAQTCGRKRQMTAIAWNATLLIQFENESIKHEIPSSGIYPFPGCDNVPAVKNPGKVRLVTWTKHQWLDVAKNADPDFKAFSWQQPCEYLCAFNAVFSSRFYSPSQIEFLANYFDPQEWAGKGMIVDEQKYFDVWFDVKPRVYCGYWKYMFNRLLTRLVEEGYLIFKKISNIGDVKVQSRVRLRAVDQDQLVKQFRTFLSTELTIGLYKVAPHDFVSLFHESLPPGIRAWIERRR